MAKANSIIKGKLNPFFEDAYNVLRSNIQFTSQSKNIKTLTIVSCFPGEGKSTTGINLARSISKTGMKVLFVDADLRKPMKVKHLESKDTLGLSNYIAGKAPLEKIINNTSMSNFHFVASGPQPPNPAELISSENFKRFLSEVSDKFDMVIIDTPPLGSVIDSAVISAQTDGALMVIASKGVDCQTALRAKDQLEKANANIIGVVLNKMKKSEYKKYCSHYNYYHDQKKLEKMWLREAKKLQKVEV